MKIKKLLSLIVAAAIVLCIVPFTTVDAFAAEQQTIDQLDLTLTVPQCNTYISGIDDTGESRQTPQLEVAIPENAPYSLDTGSGQDNYATWMYEHSPQYSIPTSLQRFGNEYMVGGTYYAFVRFVCGSNYVFAAAEDLAVNVTNGKFEQVYYSGGDVCTIIVSIDVEHVNDNTWTPDPNSYVNPSHDAPAIHQEHTHCTLCGNEIETRTVTDALSISAVSVTMPVLKEGDSYTIQYDEMFDGDRALPRPVVTVPEGVNYRDTLTAWVIPQEDGSFADALEARTFKKGDEIYISVMLMPNEGYAFPFDKNLEFDPDIDIDVKGGELVQKTLISARIVDQQTNEVQYLATFRLIVKVTIPKDTSPATGQSDITVYAISAVLSISILIAYVYTYILKEDRH